MAKLIISRKKEFSNRAAGYKVYLDKQEISTIASGETKEIDIPDGTHNLYVKINWYGSQKLPVTVCNGETKIVSISGNKFPRIIMLVMSLMTLLIILFRESLKTNYSFLRIPVLVITSFLILAWLYYLTIGRNEYIGIKEVIGQTE